MTTTDTTVQNLIINTMTQAQYMTITPSSTELYMITDSVPGVVDQTFNGTSANAQSGVAIAGANFIQNTATGTGSLIIGGEASDRVGATSIGYLSVVGANNTTAIGYNSQATSQYSITIGRNSKTSGASAIQIGYGTNSTANTLSVGFYNNSSTHYNWQLLDGTTGIIPNARLNSKAIDNWGCPDYSAGISMGLPTYPTSETTTTYTCPSAGIGKFWLLRAAVGYNVDIYVNNINVWSASALSAFGLTALIPLSKDDVVLVKTNGTTNTWEVATAFYPLKGEA